MKISDRLIIARKKKGLTQIEAGKITGIGNRTISDYERGVTYPNIPALEKLSKAYGVSTDYLIGITDIDGTYSEKIAKQAIKDMLINKGVLPADRDISEEELNVFLEDLSKIAAMMNKHK